MPLSKPSLKLIRRFEAKVDRNGPRAGRLGRCWVWMGARSSKGYGSFAVTRHHIVGAHRVAWEIANGPIPDGLWVLHHCDNPPCVRRSHLFLGTNSINQLDSARKLRHHESRKTHCPVEHPYDAANTFLDRGLRTCRTCRNARRRVA